MNYIFRTIYSQRWAKSDNLFLGKSSFVIVLESIAHESMQKAELIFIFLTKIIQKV